MIGRHFIVETLRKLRTIVEDDILPVIRIPMHDPDFAWHTLDRCTDCGCPGIDVGQDGDCRYRTDGREGLHAHVFHSRGFIEFHLDEIDVCEDPVGHSIEDTHLVGGTVGGTLLGAIIGGTVGGKQGALIGAAIGGGGGALAGAHVPKRRRKIFHFHDLLGYVS